MDDESAPDPGKEDLRHRRSAGAFDIRNFVGALIGIYGVVLVVMGLVDVTAADLARTGGVNANLIAGIVMVIFAAIFFLWARLRPVEVPAVAAQTPDSGGPQIDDHELGAG